MPTNDAKFTLREAVYRGFDPNFLLDTARRFFEFTWDNVSPQEFSRHYRMVRGNTMCSNARLRNLYTSTRQIIEKNVEGDLVECGCARGGSAAMIGLAQRSVGGCRPMWLFDTFEGLPSPTSNDPDRDIAQIYTGTCVGTIEEVRGLFARLQISGNVHLVQGLFQETLPQSGPGKISLLHIDGDWYDSVRACLEYLYDRVTPGGLIQFDDYGYWKGARKAIDEFFASRNIHAPLVRIDYSGRFVVKP